MPDIPIKHGFISFTGEYAPGDQPPSGYCDRHEWARVQAEAGLKQETCGECGRWKFPQELSGRTVTSHPRDAKGNVIEVTRPICKACVTEEGAK